MANKILKKNQKPQPTKNKDNSFNLLHKKKEESRLSWNFALKNTKNKEELLGFRRNPHTNPGKYLMEVSHSKTYSRARLQNFLLQLNSISRTYWMFHIHFLNSFSIKVHIILIFLTCFDKSYRDSLFLRVIYELHYCVMFVLAVYVPGQLLEENSQCPAIIYTKKVF